MRLDVYLTENKICKSRSAAQHLINIGGVLVNGKTAVKNSLEVTEADEVSIVEIKLPKYVGRGGQKLERAVELWKIDLNGKLCVDIGASTGGFTDCMLQNGAGKVYAIDVGHGQLDWKLRCDERVVCMEKTNFRYVTKEQIPEPIDFASVDVSFISLTKILPPARALLREKGEMVCLIKPQFEAGREKVGKKGVVRDRKVHIEVVRAVMNFAEESGFLVKGLTYSPIKGPEGNIEYLMWLEKTAKSLPEDDENGERTINLTADTESAMQIEAVVCEAHKALDEA